MNKILAMLLLVLAIRELIRLFTTGEVLNRWRKVSFTRDESPMMFWLTAISVVAVIIFCVLVVAGKFP